PTRAICGLAVTASSAPCNTAPSELYTRSLHDALPIFSFTSAEISIVRELGICLAVAVILDAVIVRRLVMPSVLLLIGERVWGRRDRKSTRLNSSHVKISYAVFCLKRKNNKLWHLVRRR